MHQQEILPSCIPTASAGNITWRYCMGMKFRIISAADLPAGFLVMGAASSPEILKPHLNGLHIKIWICINLHVKCMESSVESNTISTLHLLKDPVQGCWLRGCHSDRAIQILHSKDQQDQICKQTRIKLQAKPPASDAQAIKLCQSQHYFKVQATLPVRFDFYVWSVSSLTILI